MKGSSQKWVWVKEYRKIWVIDACHTNYAIPATKGGFWTWAVYGNSEPERIALGKYMPWSRI